LKSIGVSPAAFLARAAAVADPTRWRILVALGRHARTVGQLAGIVGVGSSSVTYHVKLLRGAGLVTTARVRGRTMVRRVHPCWVALVRALDDPV
jgi:DNA-binding transcriptional ArsR family regulator